MKSSLSFLAGVVGVVVLVLAARATAAIGMGVAQVSLPAPSQIWDPAVWGFDYKVAILIVLVVCAALIYLRKGPALGSRR